MRYIVAEVYFSDIMLIINLLKLSFGKMKNVHKYLLLRKHDSVQHNMYSPPTFAYKSKIRSLFSVDQ